jgi:hypothetical protein
MVITAAGAPGKILVVPDAEKYYRRGGRRRGHWSRSGRQIEPIKANSGLGAIGNALESPD